eukprot:223756_1
MEFPTLKHGEIFYVDEICRKHDNNTIRCFGRLISHDVRANRAVIENVAHEVTQCASPSPKQLTIDTEMLQENVFKINSLFQFIGEVYFQGESPLLKARIARNVDGLDVRLYDEVLDIKRKFLAQEKTAQISGE